MGPSEQELPEHRNPSRTRRALAMAGRRRPAPDRKSREAALHALVEESEEGMILADENGRILFANGAAAKLLGRSPADLVGSIGFALVRPEHLQLVQEEFGRSLTNPGLAVAFQLDVLQPDETTKTLAVTFLIPVFGLLFGVVLLDEPVGLGTLVGFAIISLGVALVTEVRLGKRLANRE